MRNRKAIASGIAIASFFAMAMFSCTHSADQVSRTVSFKSDIQPILEANCAINGSCHLGANNGNDQISFDSSVAYSTIIAKHLTAAGNPAASILYSQVSSGIMPKSPYSPLSADKVLLIHDWIEQGANNN